MPDADFSLIESAPKPAFYFFSNHTIIAVEFAAGLWRRSPPP